MILSVRNIAKHFGKNQVLSNINFEIERGKMYGIVGENGSGKSTLLKIIVGEWKGDKGSIEINGSLGYCPQYPQLFPPLTVKEHFVYFGAAYGIDNNKLKKMIQLLTEQFNYIKYIDKKVADLSGGTQQKLNLSLALIHNPDILILDEPYNGFDWDTYLKFWGYTDQLIAGGCSIIIVTHLISEKDRFNTIFNLHDGQIS